MPRGPTPPSATPDPVDRRGNRAESFDPTLARGPLGDHQRTLLQLIAAAPTANATPDAPAARTESEPSSHHHGRRNTLEETRERMPNQGPSAAEEQRESYVRAERPRVFAEPSGQESEDDLMLASSSLQAGAIARNRRLSSTAHRLNPYRITEEDRNALLEAALAGDDDAAGPDTVAEGDQLVGDTGWLRLAGRSDAERSVEVSPEERRAMRRMLLAGTDWRNDDPVARRDSPGGDDDDDERNYQSNAFADDFTWAEREMPSIWRNDPLSVPRLSALPRGGRNVRLASTGTSTLSEPPTAVSNRRESSDPAARPAAEDTDEALRPFRSGGTDLRTPRVPRDYSSGMGTSELAQSLLNNPNTNPTLRAFLRGPTDSGSASSVSTQVEASGAATADMAAPEATMRPGPTRPIDPSTSRVPRDYTRRTDLMTYFRELQQRLPERLRSSIRITQRSNDTLQPAVTGSDTESESETDQYAIDQIMARLRSPGVDHPPGQSTVAQRGSTTSRTARSFFEPSDRNGANSDAARRLFRRGDDSDSDSDNGRGPDTDESRPFAHATTASPRRRTREETNALMGATLRSKKSVWLLYCGSDGAAGEHPLPAGFSHASTRANNPQDVSDIAFSSGCGALVCSRALLDGVPDKVFSDGRDVAEQPAASSDLPPRADRVADLEGEGAGERVGARGWKKCKGCVTRDIACTRCGYVLGYRLLRPCVGCSISRPTYTTYASAVSNDPRSPNGTLRPILSAGGVTGGGVVDGLLFHFRRAAVTPVPRLVGIAPAEELSAEMSALRSVLAEKECDEDEDEIPRQGQRGPSAASRLREKAPQVGDKMMWKHIPSPQRDFEAGLVGEPSDWISPSSETWWLDHAIVKHSRKRSAGAAFADSDNNAFNPDSLSSARTTAGPSGISSITPPTGSPLRSSLSRSHAIRVRVPIANAHPASSISGESPADSYDRFRHDASDFARRVRQRHADPSASDSAVVTSLARAGYGSGFATEPNDTGTGMSSGREVIGR